MSFSDWIQTNASDKGLVPVLTGGGSELSEGPSTLPNMTGAEDQQSLWTNPSVIAFAGQRDPVELITERARELVLAAVDAGWDGPPYDPFELADLMGLSLRGRNEVNDARTLSDSSSSSRDSAAPLAHFTPSSEPLVIEFNPTRPRGRLRFSVGHEIAHTLFSDVAETVRHRTGQGAVPRYGGDDAWQLEMLCNIAAAEILVPDLNIQELTTKPLDLDELMLLRAKFDVSTESMLRRAVIVTGRRYSLIAFSRIARDSFRVDYVHGSRAWSGGWRAGDILNEHESETVSRACGIGFIAAAEEVWSGQRLYVQAVGIPPWPGAVDPRVLVLVAPVDGEGDGFPTLLLIPGDATEPDSIAPFVIAHVVNDRARAWGKFGFAGSLGRRYPTAVPAYRAWTIASPDNLLLGNIHLVEPEPGVWIASLVAQDGFGPSADSRLRYPALAEALARLRDFAASKGLSVHMPRIGTGQAGGSWELIADELDRQLCAYGIPTTIYSYGANQRPPRMRGSDD